MKKLLLILFFLYAYIGIGYAQHPLSNWRIKKVAVADTIKIDSLPLIPESVKIVTGNSAIIPPSAYKILGQQVIFVEAISMVDSIRINYRVFSIDLQQPIAQLDTVLIESEQKSDYIGFDYGTPTSNKTNAITRNTGLTYTGSFARGVSFGNSQDLVLNSSFNLQIAGKVGDDTEIIAALTDENIPLQAEGNTQQLNEFDKIFIQINRHNTSLTAGDYELQNPTGYFSKYFKKLQGLTFRWDNILDKEEPIQSASNLEEKDKQLSTQASVAVSRGKFARNNITPQEGNQGPYRLMGNQGEPFIIVLAGTEKVYIDGQLLIRGIEEDYVIDYNRGELTFMNRQLITKDRRIIVELEYVDQSFQRSLYAWNTKYETQKASVYFNVIAQQDSKNALGDTELSDAQLLQLQDVGDNLQNAFSSSIRAIEDEFSPARIQYIQKDTFYFISDSTNQAIRIPATILMQTSNSQAELFTARFTEVGFGNGDYLETMATGANGRVYEWVAPNELGMRQGNFAPVQQLTAPEKQQLFTLGTTYDFSQFSNLSLEGALSNTDLNRLSNKDQSDNQGTALYLNYAIDRPIGQKDWRLESLFKYEFVQQNFQALNPYRAPEFNRDWNIAFANSLEKEDEQVGQGSIHFAKGETIDLGYTFSGFFRGDTYDGRKHYFNARYTDAGYHINLEGNLLSTTTDIEQTQFSRPKLSISKTFQQLNNWTIGAYGEREKNERLDILADTLSAASFHWDLYKVFIKKPTTGKFSWQLEYLKRYDYAPLNKSFLKSTTADEVNLLGTWQYQRGGQLKWNFTYRNLAINNKELTDQEARATYLGRLDYNVQLWKGALRMHTNYEIGAGQEAKNEFQFIRVNTGEGTFVWNPTEEFDLNGDSIPQLNEFVVSPFRDQANYIRINTFTNDFIRTNNVLLNQSLHLSPRAIWYNKADWKKALSKFSTVSTLRINRKIRANDGVSVWNPFELDIVDTSLVNITANIRNVLYFNQQDPIYDMQLGHFDNRSRNVLTTGFESSKNAEQFFRARWTINSYWISEFNAQLGKRIRSSELFANRDYSIRYQKIIPKITYVPNAQWEAALIYELQNAKNELPDARSTAVFHDLKASLQYNKTQKTVFRSELSFVQIALTGSTNPTLELALLEGLKDGQNFLWTVSMDRQLANNLQLGIQYEGRKTGERTVVHLGSMMVRATF